LRKKHRRGDRMSLSNARDFLSEGQCRPHPDYEKKNAEQRKADDLDAIKAANSFKEPRNHGTPPSRYVRLDGDGGIVLQGERHQQPGSLVNAQPRKWQWGCRHTMR
jgi:hypothetical protein